MVNFMLESPAEQSVGLDDKRGAIELGQGCLDLRRPPDFAAYALNAEAALEFHLLLLPVFERGINENQRHDVFNFYIFSVHL